MRIPRAKVKRRPHKYGAKAAVGIDGHRYDSKGEAMRANELEMARRNGDIRLLLRQVPFHLPGGTKLVLDFVWIDSDGNVVFEDFKGVETDAFKIKKREVEAHYDIEITVSRRGGTKR